MNNLQSASRQRKLSIAQALGWSFFLTLLIGGVGTLFAYVPDFQPTPVLGLITVWGLSFAIGAAGFWNARRPHWIANFIVSFSLINLFLAGAIRGLGPYLSSWLWLALFVSAYLFVWILPLWNTRLAKAIHDEQVQPRTWFGRNQVLVACLATGLVAVIVAIFSQGRIRSIHPIMLVFGSIFSILAIGGGQYFAYQVRKSWEEQTRSGKTVSGDFITKNTPVSLKTSRLLQEGLSKVARGKFDAAIEKFSKAIEIEPETVDAYLFRGNAYIDLGEYQRAVPDLDYAIRIKPDYGAAYYNRSIARMALGQAELALSDLDEAIRLEPGERGYYLHRSVVHLFREEYEAALEDAAQVIELGDARAGHNNRAVIFENKGDLPSAIAEWTRVLAIDPKNARSYCRRGILLAMTGNRTDAIKDLNRGLKYPKKLPDPLREKAEKTLQELNEAAEQ